MKISDIIRKFADHLDQQEGEHDSEQEIDPAHTVPQATENPATMIPPLQQKLELLKKSVGVDSVFDSDSDSSDDDELDDIKKLTGIPSVMIQMDDSDLEGQ
jgi:hypothetical protein